MFGGSMLTNEVTIMPGKGRLVLTGQLRDVMQESAQAALSYVRSRAYNLALAADFAQKIDIHVHFPGDHIPKDGPSAGITMATAMVSALTRIPVRRDVAMTGEISLRGRVLPIGGVKDKVLAAHRGGIKTVLLPKENRKDLREVPKIVRKALSFVFVEHMDEVLKHALALPEPELFLQQLQRPLLLPDIRYVDPALVPVLAPNAVVASEDAEPSVPMTHM
jgi:ATP-dependent Lon protease